VVVPGVEVHVVDAEVDAGENEDDFEDPEYDAEEWDDIDALPREDSIL
jgi:hypothetical protein